MKRRCTCLLVGRAVLSFGLVLVVCVHSLGLSASAQVPAMAKPIVTPNEQEDDWRFEEEYNLVNQSLNTQPGPPGAGGGRGATPGQLPQTGRHTKSKAAAPSRLGLSTGGAKDIANFRENIAKGFMPLPSDVTYEGIFYDYFFDTGNQAKCDTLFCPTYSQAVSRDPVTGEAQHYLNVGLVSNVAADDFKRKKLNLVVVLDISGSMSSPFESYYYDNFGNKQTHNSDMSVKKTKLQSAVDAVSGLLDHLQQDDRFGFVLFDQYAYVALTVKPVAARNMGIIKHHIQALTVRGSTNLDAGLAKATELLSQTRDLDPDTYENRIIFVTDAMPNTAQTSDKAFLERIAANAANRVYTTVIGVGVDFNTTLVEKITKARGANYYSVHDAREFKKRLDEEFDFMVTPLVFDLELQCVGKGVTIQNVYGSPEADLATGKLLRVNTLFPSPTQDEKTRGGLILVKLGLTGETSNLVLTATYEDRSGKKQSVTQRVDVRSGEESYDSPSVRKGILLARYVSLLKDWIASDRQVEIKTVPDDKGGQIALGEWERLSQSWRVSPEKRKTFAAFKTYFEKQATLCDDKELSQELGILSKLSRSEQETAQ